MYQSTHCVWSEEKGECDPKNSIPTVMVVEALCSEDGPDKRIMGRSSRTLIQSICQDNKGVPREEEAHHSLEVK